MDAIFYVSKSGCRWRLLPCDFPPWETVHHYFGRWSLDGAWERVHHTIRERLRATLGRAARPSAAIADSQSAKTTGVGGEARGYDRAKLPSRKEAPHLGGHRGFCPRGQDPQRQRPRLRRHRVAARRIRAPWPPTPLSPVARRRLPRTGQGVGRKRTRLERRGRAQASEACCREDGQDLGGGMGQRRQKGRLAEAHAAAGLWSVARAVGGRARLCLALPRSSHE